MDKNKYEQILSGTEKTPSVVAEVRCLGLTFPNERARRDHFIEELRKKLHDPEFLKFDGFPVGSIEDILALSDPPYYTACPNPWIEHQIREWESGKTCNEGAQHYHREPFAVDVSEGKNDPIYNAHTYHTKVPPKALVHYILHYTNPGDVVLDAFCGTGMVGVGAMLCGSHETITSLGYSIDSGGQIFDTENRLFSKIGKRNAILSDLSPVASFIAYNYSNIADFSLFVDEASSLIDKVESELEWLYRGTTEGKVINSVWSDVFICPNCGHDFVFWDVAVKDGQIQESFPCSHCGSFVGKAASKATGAVKLDRKFTSIYDPILQKTIQIPSLVLVEETIKVGKGKRIIKITGSDREYISSKFDGRVWPEVPIDEFLPGRQTNKLINGSGITHVCHMYTQRALYSYATLWMQNLSSAKHTSMFRFCLSSINNYISRKQGYFGGGGGVSGTLFTPSLHLERNVFDVLRRKLKKIKSINLCDSSNTIVSNQSVTDLRNVPNDSVDYIFTDPPFGEPLQYAELNSFIEAWLKIKTVVQDDCVLNYVHNKDLAFYSKIMHHAFKEYGRILKAGKWITIEFHNSQNSVWSSIQQAIEASGLVVADVRVLDKQQRSFNAVNRSGAVDQDLVISAYKPNGGLEGRFQLIAGTEEGVWDFIRTHLKQHPIFVSVGGRVEIIAERQNFLLFDRMIAFHVQRGVSVPISASEFYAGLDQRFPERDGMYFLPEQVVEYDKKRMTASEIAPLQLFVTDEASAIQWLRQQLLKKPQTTGELTPQFMIEISGWQKTEKLLELNLLLEQNFIQYDGKGDVPSQIHSYLSSNIKDMRNLQKSDSSLQEKANNRWYVPDSGKAGDLEKLREKSLLREFADYTESKKRLKIFRLEAIKAGFKKAWQERDYATIINVAHKIPESILQEDPKLLMWYDQAITRAGE